MDQPSTPAGDYLTIAEAADALDVTPWQVVRMIENNELASVTVVPASALRNVKEVSA